MWFPVPVHVQSPLSGGNAGWLWVGSWAREHRQIKNTQLQPSAESSARSSFLTRLMRTVPGWKRRWDSIFQQNEHLANMEVYLGVYSIYIRGISSAKRHPLGVSLQHLFVFLCNESSSNWDSMESERLQQRKETPPDSLLAGKPTQWLCVRMSRSVCSLICRIWTRGFPLLPFLLLLSFYLSVIFLHPRHNHISMSKQDMVEDRQWLS